MSLETGDVRVILIGGTSNVGKSTLAAELSAKLGWETMSTDSLAFHPGRPWKSGGKEAPAEVIEYFATHSVEWLLEDVLAHYGSLWERVAEIIRQRVEAAGAAELILEGSALWPENVATLPASLDRKIASCWLTASPESLETRILSASDFSDLSSAKQDAVRGFVARTHAYQAKMIDNVRMQSLPVLDTEQHDTAEHLAGAFLNNCLS